MSDEDGLWASIQAEWIKVCPCRLIRKNICMFNIVLGCLALVVWTIIATIEDPNAVDAENATEASNISHVLIDDTKGIHLLNLTLKTEVESAEAVPTPKPTPPPPAALIARPKISVTRITNSEGDDVCKCICNFNVTEEEMVEALMYFIEARDNDVEEEIGNG